MFGELLNGIILPFALTVCGVTLALKIRLFRILSPLGFFRDLKSAGNKEGISPFVSLCTALAGTLGVGNIAGVATAIGSGGPGAVFWMWLGAIVSESVKYGEVTLAVKFRRRSKDGFYGGAMYTIRDGLSGTLGRRPSSVLGAVFAALCIVNSLVMGDLIQANAASAAATSETGKIAVSFLMAACVAAAAAFGSGKIGKVTSFLIPPLSLCYIAVSLYVITVNHILVPSVFRDIFSEAFCFKAAAGGVVGSVARKAVRYGVTRGIFSNEAGCGTSPTAHAASNTDSPHKQGCFGIFEVIFDTLILCTLTALVILIGQKKLNIVCVGGISDALTIFGKLAGAPAYYVISVSVFLFAFATIIAQFYYGRIAIGYLSGSRAARAAYGVAVTAVAAAGGMINPGIMWELADVTIGIMTVINVSVLLALSGMISKEAQTGIKSRKKPKEKAVRTS